jgi:hypothetical protein
MTQISIYKTHLRNKCVKAFGSEKGTDRMHSLSTDIKSARKTDNI